MVRLLARITISLIANALGLLAAALLLRPEFSIDIVSFIIVTAVFTVVEVVAGPLILSISVKHVPALAGGVALITTFVGLLVTDLLLEGLRIEGIATWALASLIVWLGALLAGLVLPLFLFKNVLRKENSPGG